MEGLTGSDSVESHVCYLLDLNPSQLRILEALLDSEDKDTISSRYIQETLGLDSSYVSRILARLMGKGLVSRKYVFRKNSPPRYCYTPVTREDFENRINDAVSTMTQQLESVGLFMEDISEDIDADSE